MAETIVQKKKGTPKTEQIIGAGAAKLEVAIKNIKTATDGLSSLTTMVNDYTVKIVDAEQKLTELSVKFKEEQRQRTVQLEQDIKEHGLALAAQLFIQEGKVAV